MSHGAWISLFQDLLLGVQNRAIQLPMENQRPFYVQKLQESYERRKRKNSNYSLRAFAMYLDVNPSLLSELFNGKRKLPLKYAQGISEKLNLGPLEEKEFCRSVYESKASLMHLANIKSSGQKKVLKEQKYYSLVAKWEYFAIFSLIETIDFKSCPKWIANRLALDPKLVELYLNELVELNIIGLDSVDGYYRKVEHLTSTFDIPSSAIRVSHKEFFEQASEALESRSVEERYYSNSTLAIDKNRLPEAKNLIREFRDKIRKYLSAGDTNEVYKIGFQLFPVTNQYEENSK